MLLKSCGILGVGSYVPDRVVTNFDLEEMVDTSDDWIRTRTGIRERRIVDKNTNTSDLATYAGKEALKDAGVSPADVDLLILATASPEMIFPSTACLAQEKMGLNSPAFDIQAACSSFVFGLSLASQYVATGAYKKVLLIGADALSRHINWADRNTCVLFGDGAGAVVLGETEEGYGVLSSYLGSDGSGAELLKIPAGGSKLPGNEKSVKEGLHYVQMNGNEIFKFAVKVTPEAARKTLEVCNLSLEDVDYFIPHQANKRIIDSAISRLKIDESKVVNNLHKYGNTSAASIPLALDEIYKDGKLKRGDIVLLVGFGAGLTWGANVIKWNKNRFKVKS